MDSLGSLSFVDSLSYFQDFSSELSDLNEHMPLPIPAFVNNSSQVSLAGRVSAQHNFKELGLFELAPKNNAQNLEAQLQEFFKATERTQKLFLVNGSKIGILFNPKRETLKIGFLSISSPVIIVSDKTIPEDLFKRITSTIPQGFNFSTFQGSTINGQTVMKLFGFE